MCERSGRNVRFDMGFMEELFNSKLGLSFKDYFMYQHLDLGTIIQYEKRRENIPDGISTRTENLHYYFFGHRDIQKKAHTSPLADLDMDEESFMRLVKK